MVKIDRISIQNFKNIETADVKLGSLNVMVGPNGSGKSNFLMVTSFLNFIINGSNESIKTLLSYGRGYSFGRFFLEITFGEKKKIEKCGECLSIDIEFSDTNTNCVYRYLLRIRRSDIQNAQSKNFIIYEEDFTFKKKGKPGKAVSLMAKRQNTISFHKDINSFFPSKNITDLNVSGIKLLDLILKTNADLSKEYGHAIEALNKVLKTSTVYLSSHALKYNNDEISSVADNRLVSFDLESQVIKLSESDQWETFKRAVREILGFSEVLVLDFNSASESSREPKKIVGYYRKTRGTLMQELSDGEVVLIGLIAKIVTDNSDIIFVEEIENSIHPKALRSLVDLMHSYCDERQFLVSTHSATLLNMIKPENVIVSTINENDLAEISMIKNLKELNKKLSHGFISFGDLLYSNVANSKDEFEDIL